MTDAELGAERLAALLDAERENTALRAEVERLRAERAGMDEWLRTMIPNDKATAAERAAVVAWLRSEAEASAQTFTGQAWVWAKRIDDMADEIERGEHRREEGA